MAREYVEKNTAEMVRCLKELVAIPGIFEDAPSKGAPFGKNIQKSLEYVLIAILLINANSRCEEPPFAIVRTYCF